MHSKVLLMRHRRMVGIACALALGFATGLASNILSLPTTATVGLWFVSVTSGVLVIGPRVLRRHSQPRLDVYLTPSSDFRTVKIWRGNELVMSVATEHPFVDTGSPHRKQ